MGKTAAIAGYTGLIGSDVFSFARALRVYDRIILLQRRETAAARRGYVAVGIADRPEVVTRVVDYERLSAGDLAGAEDVFCALGTTIKKAGSQAGFRKVDFDAIVNLANASVEAGAKRFVLVSSVGADPRSKNFYLRVKGETEQAVATLQFEAVHIMRPGLLLGRRNESRPGEAVAQVIMPKLKWVLAGTLRKYRAVPAETVAKAMIGAAQSSAKGMQVYQHDQIVEMAKG